MGASERNERTRRAWHRIVKNLDPRRLVFVDESGATITLARRYGRAPQGERAHGRAPRNHGQNLTLVAGLSLSGLQAPMLLDGAMNSQAFALYVEHFLVPSLRPGQLVILDNLAVHKQQPIHRAITTAGCRVLFLPSYSPDLNPIEQAFSKIKAYIRRVGARTREALEAAIATAIDRITTTDARGYFHHCGYQESDLKL
jgi:transposase